MARYSAISLLDKILLYRSILKQLEQDNNIVCRSHHINILLAVRVMNRRYRETNLFGINRFLSANKKSIGYIVIEKHLNTFADHSLIRIEGKSLKRYYITESGLQLLEDIERKIRTTHFKFNRKESTKVKPVGPAKVGRY